MINNINYRAKRKEFIVFLSSAMENNNAEGVSQWVSDVLLSSAKPLLSDDKIAFLEAEKLQLMSYIENKKFSNFRTLFNAVACNDNKKLKKLQCKILVESLLEKREELTNDTTHNKELNNLLDEIFSKLEPEYQKEMSSIVNEALSVVRDSEKQDDVSPTGELRETSTQGCKDQQSLS